MKIKNCKSVVFYSIFLSMMYLTTEIVYSYDRKINVIERPIEFKLVVEDSLLVGTADDLDFGDIIKGSTDIRRAETKIDVRAGTDVNYVTAEYVSGQLQTDKTQKIQISYKEENKTDKNIRVEKKKEAINEGTDKIDVFFIPFDTKYQLVKDNKENKGEIPVVAEIRGIGDAKLGKYEGVMRVKLMAITTNNEKVIEK